jgi:NAD(P)-dependent dehydrogenase (short-subunit alcohol dehydrogenase family)
MVGMRGRRSQRAGSGGYSRGIGAAVAIALAEAGADVAVNFRERADVAGFAPSGGQVNCCLTWRRTPAREGKGDREKMAPK